MVEILPRNWGWVALSGAAALVFGVLTLVNPAMSLGALILMFGAYALVYGLFTATAAVARHRGEPHWLALLINGILSIAIGIITFFLPRVTAIVLLYLIAAWAIATGVAEIVAGIRLRRVITGEWLLILAGVLSLLVGVLLILFPGAGALTVVIWIGAYAVVLGMVLLALAFRLRAWGRGHGADTVARAV